MKHRYDYYDVIVLEIIDKVFIRYKATPLIFNTHRSIYSTKTQSRKCVLDDWACIV